jgi:hypothetical protein
MMYKHTSCVAFLQEDLQHTTSCLLAGKAMVYTAAAGLQPHHVLPIQLDVGCNTAEVRDDSLYMGLQQVGGSCPCK